MRILIYGFSGTGNTLKIAQRYREEFMPCETVIYEAGAGYEGAPDPDDFAIVGFGYPVHALNAPEIIVKLAKNMPDVCDKPLFIFKTSGEPLWVNDASSFKLAKILRKKGFRIISERHFVMPYNMIYRHSAGMANLMCVYAKALVKSHAEEILSLKEEKFKFPLYKRMLSAVFRIEWPFAKLHGRCFKVDKQKCKNCGACVKNCPMQNIKEENGKYKFGSHCVLCVRCSFNCPAGAVNIGILNGWKVNGAYRISESLNAPPSELPDVNCLDFKVDKMYRKYFASLREKLMVYYKNMEA